MGHKDPQAPWAKGYLGSGADRTQTQLTSKPCDHPLLVFLQRSTSIFQSKTEAQSHSVPLSFLD